MVNILKGIFRCAVLVRTLTYISETTGFDWGKYLEDPEQVRAYFKVEALSGFVLSGMV